MKSKGHLQRDLLEQFGRESRIRFEPTGAVELDREPAVPSLEHRGRFGNELGVCVHHQERVGEVG